MPKFKVKGSLYEPGADGTDKNGYIRFWDVYEVNSEAEAKQFAEEDYGDYMNVEVHGLVKDDLDQHAWLAHNRE